MPTIELDTFAIFFAAALVIAISPGPGILYVAARTLAGGRTVGLASSFGTSLGGLVHVIGGAVGLSALVMASAEAFTTLKLVGAAYLIWLGIKTVREAKVVMPIEAQRTGAGLAFRDGVIVEALNPKTAAFFLAFIPQFIDPAQGIAAQFVMLGVVSVTLNTLADIVVTYSAARARAGMESHPLLVQRLRQGSGLALCGLGTLLVFARRTG
ncbi:MAG: LysE family translocator [Hyphomicrobiaceae bacterium]